MEEERLTRARAVKLEDEIARRGIKLRGKVERCGPCPKCGGTDRFSINTSKQVWNCRSCGKGGDVIELVEHLDGADFQTAVTTLAGGEPPNGKLSTKLITPEPPPAMSESDYGIETIRREITATYGYTDADGLLVYQTCRKEWVENGKRRKTFVQRRPHGVVTERREDQTWIYGLTAGTYVRGSDGHFYRADPNKQTKAERIDVDVCPHILYRLPDLREELAQPADERRAIFVPEGEADVETLIAWGIAATTNSGGAQNWRPEHAEELRGADVVVLLDNDKAGRDRGKALAKSLYGVAARVRMLDWSEHWRGCPPKADVSDWRDMAGGTSAKLWEIVESLPEWKPSTSWKFYSGEATPLTRWLIKGILPETGTALISGQWGTYKTTVALEICICAMTGEAFAGRFRIKRRGAVLFVALEGATAIPRRLKTVADHHGISEQLPFAYRDDCPPLTSDAAAKALCALFDEAKTYMEAKFRMPVVLVVIDTLITAAQHKEGGDSDTAASQKVMNAMSWLSRHSGALVVGVDHFGKIVDTGTRGSSAKEGAADAVLALIADREIGGVVKNTKLGMRKQRDGISGFEIPFTMKTVETGTDEDGDPITAQVIEWQAPQQTAQKTDVKWTPSMQLLRRVLTTMLVDHGQTARPFFDGPEVRACKLDLVRAEFYRQHPADGTDKQKHEARRKAFARALRDAATRGVAMTREVGDAQLIWIN